MQGWVVCALMPPPHSGPRRGVLYGRVSKAARRKGPSEGGGAAAASVDQQLAALTAQAQREGVEIIGPFRDDGISASRFAGGKTREGWEQTMEALLSGAANELWTWEISRATRDRPVWAALVNACIARHILICVNGRLHDPHDPDDGFMLDLQAALAVRESAVTSKRIRRDVAARVAAGKPHGKLPYGYVREYDPRSGVLLRQVKDPETAPIIEEMARRVLAGESMYAVAADLDSRGIPCPEAARIRRMTGAVPEGMGWRGDEVRDQLLSPANAGLRSHNGVVVGEAAWPAIISAADHAALVERLRGDGRPGWFGPAKHLLTGIAECGVCGAKLRRTKNRGYPSYSCPGKDGRGSSCVARLQAPLDALVAAHVIGRLEDPSLLEEMVRSRSGHDERAAQASRELADLRARLAEMEASAATIGGISADSFVRIQVQLHAKIEEVRGRLVEVQPLPPVVLALAGPDAAARWVSIDDDPNLQRQAVRSLFRVVVNRSSRPRGVRGFDASAIDLIPI